ncbi:MAG TPA: hypothetical protein DDY14_14930 [Chromatiaceae bacterium]|nr:MAG: hypothetical protein N838_22125 [Thiohalocapsa sp. PB-PSB1]QQO53766.1 MAG: M48 family metallopeptidase [Thiohalocapsa sp. PB-PSB1]HBG96577.1 hypothetical protein [Chromatiaceae bacterium]HCS91639.1 hypothetical protein [Chromatiaceae bacterium]
MRYVPKLVRDDVNVSKQHPLAEAGSLIVGLGLTFAAIIVVIVYMVDIVLLFVSPEQEVAMFEAWTPAAANTADVDDERLAALQELTARLAQHWPDSPYRTRVAILSSDEPNALALPGGLILISSELLDQVESENELAFVIGHELGHFKHRDHIRALGRGVALGILFAAVSGSGSASALGGYISQLTLRGFSREQEANADEFGLQLVQREYGHVAEATRFFERLSQDGGAANKTMAYVSTHPLPSERIDALLQFAASRGWPTTGEVRPLNR